MPTQTQHAACSQAPGSATQRARPLLPTCSWFLLMQTRLLLLPAKGVWHRQPRPGGRLRLGAKGTASATAAVRVSSESAGRRWPVAPDAGARAPQGGSRHQAGRDGLVRAFGAAGRSSAPTNTNRFARARGLVGARAPAAHGGGTGRPWQSVSRNCCPSPVALVRYASLKPKERRVVQGAQAPGWWMRGTDYSCGELPCLRTLRAQAAAVAVDRQPHR